MHFTVTRREYPLKHGSFGMKMPYARKHAPPHRSPHTKNPPSSLSYPITPSIHTTQFESQARPDCGNCGEECQLFQVQLKDVFVLLFFVLVFFLIPPSLLFYFLELPRL